MGEIRFVGTGESRGYPYLVCKNSLILVCPHVGSITHWLKLADFPFARQTMVCYSN